MLRLWLFDLLAAFVLSVTALGGAYLPVILARQGRASGERSLSFVLGNMLSAGVMVSAGFCHLLGDAIETLSQATAYPLAPFLCACGFLSTLMADQVVDVITSKPDTNSEGSRMTSIAVQDSQYSSHGHGHALHFGAAVQCITNSTALQRPGDTLAPRSEAGGAGSPVRRKAHEPSPQKCNGAHELVPDEDEDDDSSQSLRPPGNPLSDELSDEKVTQQADSHLQSGDGYAHSNSRPANSASFAFEAEKPGRSQVTFLTAVLMGVALTFHSLLEGAALGAQQSIGSTLHIFIAIQAHKGLAAYALGSSIVDSDADIRQFWSVILMFAFATPVGVFFGYLLSANSTSNGAAAVSAVASGTFLYVAFMEVLPRELDNSNHRVLKLAMLLIGFGLMSLLAIWA